MNVKPACTECPYRDLKIGATENYVCWLDRGLCIKQVDAIYDKYPSCRRFQDASEYIYQGKNGMHE